MPMTPADGVPLGLVLAAWFYTIVAPIFVVALPVTFVLWRRERKARRQSEEELDRQKIRLARRAIARLKPDVKESSDFWPYEDVEKFAFGPDEETHARS